MDVIWWGVPIAGCIALAACVAAALLPPRSDQPETLRPLANTNRLTELPEYARAARLQTIAACVAAVLLIIAFAATVLAAARPTGLPAPDRRIATDQPEDIMVCVGGPASDPAVDGALRYFAEAVRGFGTERIGLTSANRRLVPLTRDYQWAAGRFAGYAQPTEPLVSPVAYTDYATSVEDVLAMCLTGFPDFEEGPAQRRSLIYVGPASMGVDARSSVFTDERVRELAVTAGVQVNAITDGEGLPADLARATGGLAFAESTDVAKHLSDIRSRPPGAQGDADTAAARSEETPDLLLVAALLAVIALLAWPRVVLRRSSISRKALIAAVLLLLGAALRPVIGGGEPAMMRIAGERDPNVFVIVDRSADMSVADGGGRTRMDSARDDIGALIDRYPDARFAVISFDARPALEWPLSADSWSLRPVLAAAMPYGRTAEDTTNAGAASNVLRYQLIGARQQYPRARNLVYYVGAGAPGSTVRQREFRIPENAVDGGAVIGYGDAGLSSLRAVADQIGVPYVPRADPRSLERVAPDDPAAAEMPEDAPSSSGFELYWAPAGAAALLILFALHRALRDLHRTRLDRIAVGR